MKKNDSFPNIIHLLKTETEKILFPTKNFETIEA